MMKILKINLKEMVIDCQLYFGLPPATGAIKKQKVNFGHKISTTCNVARKQFVSTASSEMSTLCSAT